MPRKAIAAGGQTAAPRRAAPTRRHIQRETDSRDFQIGISTPRPSFPRIEQHIRALVRFKLADEKKSGAWRREPRTNLSR